VARVSARCLLLGLHGPSSRQGRPFLARGSHRNHSERGASRASWPAWHGMKKHIRPRSSRLLSFLLSPASGTVWASGVVAGVRSEAFRAWTPPLVGRGWAGPNPSLQRTRLRSPLNSISLGHRMTKNSSKPVRRFLFPLALFMLASCATSSSKRHVEAQASRQCEEPGNCATLTLAPGVVLSPREACWASLLKSRCNAHDTCVLKCLLSGEGRTVGGGCFHICANTLTRVGGELLPCPNTPVPGWEQCQHLSN
jgi:hypothetical protein